MRVSSTMMTGNYMKQLNRSYEKQSKLMEQGDGLRIHRPSDDPVQFVRSMTFKSSLSQNEQYTQSLKDAVSWMKTSDGAMINMTDILKTISEKTLAAANETNTTEDMKKIAQEIDGLIEQLVTLGNTQLGDRYVFAGQADKTQPFVIGEVKDKADVKTLDDKQLEVFGTNQMIQMEDADHNIFYWDEKTGNLYSKDYVDTGYKKVLSDNADKSVDEIKQAVQNGNSGNFNGKIKDIFNTKGQVTGTYTAATNDGKNLTFTTSDKRVVTYTGDDIKISMPIQNGDATPRRDSVNVTGGDLFGRDIFGGVGSSLMNDLYEISNHMKSGDSNWLSGDGVKLSENAYNQMLQGQTEIAARTQTYNSTLDIFESQNTIITSDLTNASASDIAALSIELMTAQTLYNMSLSLGSKILPQSLSDYL